MFYITQTKKAKMVKYVVIANKFTAYPGQLLKLTEKQLKRRIDLIQEVEKGIYTPKRPIDFKRGETIETNLEINNIL